MLDTIEHYFFYVNAKLWVMFVQLDEKTGELTVRLEEK